MAEKTKISENASFLVKDCALAAIATGQKAENLKELRYNLLGVHPDCIYYHFWGGLLRPRFDDPEYNNDFAAWARHALHDAPLAERLGSIDPTAFLDLEDLRDEVVEVIEERLDEITHVPWAPRDQAFHFIRSQIVVFETNRSVDKPADLAELLPHLSPGSVFYHFVDSRRRDPVGSDDFQAWLRWQGKEYGDLCRKIASIDPYFGSLATLRAELTELFRNHFGGAA